MGAFEYRQAEEIRDAFARHGVRYLFLGKSVRFSSVFPTPHKMPTFTSTSHQPIVRPRQMHFATLDSLCRKMRPASLLVERISSSFDPGHSMSI